MRSSAAADLLLELLVDLQTDVADASHALAQVVEVLVLLPAQGRWCARDVKFEEQQVQGLGGWEQGALTTASSQRLPASRCLSGLALTACCRNQAMGGCKSAFSRMLSVTAVQEPPRNGAYRRLHRATHPRSRIPEPRAR